MKIEIKNFSGIIPRVSPELLPDNAAQTAENMSVKSGKIHPEKFFTVHIPDRDYVAGQINDDQYHRLYFLNDAGTLYAAGTFPDENGNISEEITSRKVGVSAPLKPEVISISSPFLDSLGAAGFNNAVMVANCRDAYADKLAKLGYIVYAKRELEPVDAAWTIRTDGSVTRTYKFSPYRLSVFIPNE